MHAKETSSQTMTNNNGKMPNKKTKLKRRKLPLQENRGIPCQCNSNLKENLLLKKIKKKVQTKERNNNPKNPENNPLASLKPIQEKTKVKS